MNDPADEMGGLSTDFKNIVGTSLLRKVLLVLVKINIIAQFLN